MALDVEGDGMFRYRARVCTVQLATDTEIAIVDTLRIEPTLLAELLSADGPEKIVHDASFDARMLSAAGAPLDRVFDTAVAARFLGVKSTGLSSMLSARFEVSLEKSHQQADWGLRPISEAMLRYLEDDVRYLGRLHDVLLDEVRALDIEPEVRQECAYVLSQAVQPTASGSAFSRFKGAGQLLPFQRARLYLFVTEREEIARAEDVPAGRVLSNELILRLATHPTLDEAAVKQVLGARGEPYLARLSECVHRAKDLSDAPAEEVAQVNPAPPSLSQIEARKRRRKWLTELRQREATTRGVDPQVVLPGHCLSDVADLPVLDDELLREVPGFGAFRVERYGRLLREEFASRW